MVTNGGTISITFVRPFPGQGRGRTKVIGKRQKIKEKMQWLATIYDKQDTLQQGALRPFLPSFFPIPFFSVYFLPLAPPWCPSFLVCYWQIHCVAYAQHFIFVPHKFPRPKSRCGIKYTKRQKEKATRTKREGEQSVRLQCQSNKKQTTLTLSNRPFSLSPPSP